MGGPFSSIMDPQFSLFPLPLKSKTVKNIPLTIVDQSSEVMTFFFNEHSLFGLLSTKQRLFSQNHLYL